MSIIRILQKFEEILSSHQKIRILELAFLMVIGGMLETCSVSLMLPFMDVVMNPKETMDKWYAKWICGVLSIQSPRSFLVIIAIALAVIYILKNMYLLIEFNIQYRFVYGNMFAMQQNLLECFINRPYECFLKVSSGEVIRMINNDTANAFSLLMTLLNLFTELVVSGMLIITIFAIAPGATMVIAAVLLLLVILINILIKPVLRKAGVSYQNAFAEMNKWLLQSIQGIKELKVMNKESFFFDNYAHNGQVYVNSLRKNQILNLMPRFFIEAASMGTMFLVVAVMIYNGSEFERMVPMLSAVALAAVRLLPSANRISSALASVSYNEPMLDKLSENLRNITGTKKADLTESEKGQIASVRQAVTFDQITYCYPGAESDVLSEASMVIKYGESVGIAGASGAGKTTAVDIVLGLLRPKSGHVFVDQTDISADIKGWHKQIGYIPQTIFMLDDSIKHNVCFGVDEDEISDEQLWRALEEASLSEFVKTLPDGADTQIGERGVRLSGGQRQRIGIARALYSDPSVLIFDEATSALDHETESAIMESIYSLHGQKTMIIIAHRLSTIEACDHIYRVEDGKIKLER